MSEIKPWRGNIGKHDAYIIMCDVLNALCEKEAIKKAVYERLRQAPSIDRWIPCSERLPKENVPVNITWVNRNPVSYYADIKDIPFTATGVYFEGKWYWWSSIVEDLLAECGRTQWDRIVELMDESIEVIAWMPLPQPWKGEEK